MIVNIKEWCEKIKYFIVTRKILHLCDPAKQAKDEKNIISKLNGDSGVVFYSSGSTGTPKACLHNLRLMYEKYEGLEKKYHSAVLTFPITHIGGFNTALYYKENLVIPPIVEPSVVFSLIEKHKIEVLPTSPSFLNLSLLQGAHKTFDTSSLKLITYGSEPTSEGFLLKLKEAFPHVTLKQTYGLSETGIFSTKSKEDGSLWIKINDDFKVEDGLLWVKKPPSMIGYLNYPNIFGEYFPTNDSVERDGEWVKILGRREEIINVGGRKVYPAEVENIILSLSYIEDAAVFPFKNKIMGEIVAAIVQVKEPQTAAITPALIKDFCKIFLPKYKIPLKIYFQKIKYQNSKKIRNPESYMLS